VGVKLGFEKSFKKSVFYFDNLIKPILLEWGGFGSIQSIEANIELEIASLLDATAGIDVFFSDTTGMGGLASRIQSGCVKSWDTFTVRKSRESGAKTEFDKRKDALRSNGKYIYPYYTLQAYIDKDDNLLSMAVVCTRDLIELIDMGEYRVNHTGAVQIGQAEFYIVDWSMFSKHNKSIYIHR
jgi:hypothetical protein